MPPFLPGDEGETDDSHLASMNCANYGGSSRQPAAMKHDRQQGMARLAVHDSGAQMPRYSALGWPMTYRSGSSSRASREWPQSRRSRLELAVGPAAARIARQWPAQHLVKSGHGRAGLDIDLIDLSVPAV